MILPHANRECVQSGQNTVAFPSLTPGKGVRSRTTVPGTLSVHN